MNTLLSSRRAMPRQLSLTHTKLPRIASTDIRMTKEKRLHNLLEEMIQRSELSMLQETQPTTTSIIISRPQDIRLRIKGRTKIRRVPAMQRNEQEQEHEKQKIITNRTLLIKFAEKTRPMNASLSKKERLNMRIASNVIANSGREQASLNVLDRILQNQQHRAKLPDKLELELRSNLAKRRILARRIQTEVRADIDDSMRNISTASLL